MGLADILALLEHLPKVGSLLTRLMPMLENYIPGKAAPAVDEETRAAMLELRTLLAQSTTAQAALQRQSAAQSELLAQSAADAQAARAAAEAAETRLLAMQERMVAQSRWLFACSGLSAVLLVLVILLLVHH
jgi:hypothetical protein